METGQALLTIESRNSPAKEVVEITISVERIGKQLFPEEKVVNKSYPLFEPQGVEVGMLLSLQYISQDE